MSVTERNKLFVNCGKSQKGDTILVLPHFVILNSSVKALRMLAKRMLATLEVSQAATIAAQNNFLE